jgi:hypothetical protein
MAWKVNIVAMKSKAKRVDGRAQRSHSFLGSGRGLMPWIALPALATLLCFTENDQQSSVPSANFTAAPEHRDLEATAESEASPLSSSIAVAYMPDMATASERWIERTSSKDDSFEEIPAIEGSWTRELRQLSELAVHDAEAALERVSRMSVIEEREAALKEVCLALAESDPALAMRAAWHLQLGSLGGLSESTALENLASRWASADLKAALSWIDQQPIDDAGKRDRVVKGIASVWSQSAPADAARLVAEQMSPDFSQFDAAINLVGRWAAIDFSGAAAWVALFPEGPVQDRARKELSKAVPSQQP